MSINDDILLLKLIQSGNEQAFKYLLILILHRYVVLRMSMYQIPKMLKSLY